MPDYIDREKLIKSIPSVKDDKTISLFGAVADMICIVNSVPKEDVAPVVHGKWVYNKNATDWGIGGYVCSECQNRNNNLPCNRVESVRMFSGANYCPNCGAKMDL